MTAFLDTNILICAQQRGAKGETARALMAAGGRVSVQVLNEFASVARRELGQGWGEIGAAIDDALALVEPPLPLTMGMHLTARQLAEEHAIGFYDALIVAAALEAGCDTLFSEDLQDGRAFGRLRVVNSFAAAG